MVSFPQVSPAKPSIRLSSPPYALHAPPISFFSILSPAQYWVSSTDHSAPHYAVSSTPLLLVPPRPKYSPQRPVLKRPQPEILRQIIKTTRNDIQRQSEKMEEKKSLVSYWNMKQEWGRKIYIDQYNLNEKIGLAWFSLGTCKLEVKEEAQKKDNAPM